MEDDFLTNDELADLVRRPVATIRYWKHTGFGPTSFKLGRRVMYRRRDVDAWLTSLQSTQREIP